jgi:uridine kinase
LREALEREQSEAMQSIQSMFTDVERRLVERLERVVERTTAQHVDAAALQFQDAVKRSREESAKRLARELERAVETFMQQANSLMNDRLASVGDTAAQRLERRLASADASIEARRNEVALDLEQRFASAQHELRQRLDEVSADNEAERAVLEARMFELQRRLDAALAHAQTLGS